MEKFSRSVPLLTVAGLEKLNSAKVAVFGIGGVGGYTVEALARAGVGSLTLVDGDVVSMTNINRQIIALISTVGKNKAEVATQRVLDINPDCKVIAKPVFFNENTLSLFDFSQYDYVVDAIDDVKGKVLLAQKCTEQGTKIISSMGAGNKLDGTAFEVADIYKTSVCPLARTMRRELKKVGVQRLKVVYSKEEPRTPLDENGKRVPSSVSFVPSVAGLIIAGEVIKDLIQ